MTKRTFAAICTVLMISVTAFAQQQRDLSGVWAGRGTSRVFNEELGVEQPAVFTPWGQAQFDSHKTSRGPRAVPPALGNDPIGVCDPMGIPRIILYDTPTEFVHAPGRVLQFFERTHKWRTIWTDGRPLPDYDEAAFHGYAIGRWEGDTLVVESTGFDERAWLDQYGSPHSESMRLTERWRRVDRETIELNMTIQDPKTYTKTLVSGTKTFKLQRNAEIVEEHCVPSEELSFNKRVRNPAAGVNE